jgi:hypothetical protein
LGDKLEDGFKDGFKDGFNKFTARFNPAPPPQPSRASTPDPSAQLESFKRAVKQASVRVFVSTAGKD